MKKTKDKIEKAGKQQKAATKDSRKIRKTENKKPRKAARVIFTILAVLLALVLTLGIAGLIINAYVKKKGGERIVTADEACALEDVDCILVLGCSVRPGGVPSDMLRDRLTVGVDLYKGGASPKMIMSGDHGNVDYDEVNVMKRFAKDAGVPSEDVFMDHAGFSTYESVVRAKEIFGAKKVIIVTQKYHLYRALYIAQAIGLEAYGVDAELNRYYGQTMRDLREIAGRNKDFFGCLFNVPTTYMGEKIPLDGSGDITNDEYTDLH
jgi:vancomycin permeability regulator SanA